MAQAPANELVVDVERVGEAAIVRIAGSAGMGQADQLKDQLEQLLQQVVLTIVVDMGQLEFLCSAGMGALIGAHVRSRDYGGRLRLVGPAPAVLRELETTRLTKLFAIFPDLPAALGS